MKEEANRIDSLLDVIQDRLGSVIGLALGIAHGLPKGQGTHHIVAVVNAYLIHENGFPQVIIPDSSEQLACKLLDAGGIVRERCSSVRVRGSRSEGVMFQLTYLEGVIPHLSSLSVESSIPGRVDGSFHGIIKGTFARYRRKAQDRGNGRCIKYDELTRPCDGLAL
jgi:hypothetical protein